MLLVEGVLPYRTLYLFVMPPYAVAEGHRFLVGFCMEDVGGFEEGEFAGDVADEIEGFFEGRGEIDDGVMWRLSETGTATFRRKILDAAVE